MSRQLQRRTPGCRFLYPSSLTKAALYPEHSFQLQPKTKSRKPHLFFLKSDVLELQNKLQIFFQFPHTVLVMNYFKRILSESSILLINSFRSCRFVDGKTIKFQIESVSSFKMLRLLEKKTFNLDTSIIKITFGLDYLPII